MTIVAPFTATLHAPAPEHPPDHPMKVESAAALASKLTAIPGEYTSEQSAPQSIPVGVDVTRPLPLPDLVTSSDWWRANVALIAAGPLTVMEQAPVPTQSAFPVSTVQPMNCEPSPAVAASKNCPPWDTIAVHVPGQEIPTSGEVTVPVPDPPNVIVTGYRAMSDPEKLTRYGRAGRLRDEKLFRVDTMVRSYDEIYRRHLARHPIR